MPELPEVEGVVRSLKPVVEGKTIQSVQISLTVKASHEAGKQSIVKGTTPEQLIEHLEGMKIVQITRRSKYILFDLERDGQQYKMINHLGMSGGWFDLKNSEEIQEGKFQNHRHLELQLDGDQTLVYADIRRFGEVRLVENLTQFPPILKLAPEPFDADAKQYFLDCCNLPKYKNKEIKAVIMDGQVLCGCGNIYATEALFRAGIKPGRKTSLISGTKKEQLFDTIVAVLLESIAFGGSSISDYRNINGEAGGMQDRLKMYGMNICPMCHTNTKQKTIAGRNSYYCPNCQK